MKRLLAILLLWSTPLLATTYYVDGACGTAGNGTDSKCLSSPTTNNPKKLISQGIALMSAGDTLNIRGIHVAHDACPGSTDGRYHQNEYGISTVCTSIAPCIIQPFGWTDGLNTGEIVYLDGTRCPSAGSAATCGEGTGWTRCTWNGSSCDSPCADVGCGSVGCTETQASCIATWYTTDSGTAGAGFESGSASNVRFAQKDDGSPTYRLAASSNLTDLTNNHAAYNNKRCSTYTWHPCDTSSDCPGSQTCTATSAEIDSWNDTTNSRLFVRWGNTLPVKPYISYTGAGDAFALKAAGPAAWWTIRGLKLRAHTKSHIFIDPGVNNITFDDMILAFSHCGTNCDGTNRSFDLNQAGPVTIKRSEMLISADEGAHVIGKNAAATDVDMTDNWIHMNGRDSEVGPMGGAPSGITYGDDSANAATGNFSGSVISGNLIEKLERSSGSPGYGLRWEHSVKNTIIRDNYIRNTEGAPCLVLDGSSGTAGTDWNTDGNEVYNNIMDACGAAGINIFCGPTPGTMTVRNNLIFNNTVRNATDREFNQEEAGGTCTGNKVRNNIFMDSGPNDVVRWLTAAGNTNAFQNNIAYSTTSGTVVQWAGTSSNCAAIVVGANIDGDAGADASKCADPVFSNILTPDFHIQTSSPAKDAGTTTDMPAGHTTDINNTVTDDHGLPFYNDANPIQNGTWDMGADEFISGGSGTVTLDVSKTDAPDPVQLGANITYTFTYHNTGSASATNTTIIDQLPSNVTFVSCTGGSLCQQSGQNVIWTIGTLAASGSGTATLTVRVSPSIGAGSVIRNDTYAIFATETGTIFGSAVSTTTSSSSSRRGRLFPPGKR